MQNVLFLKFWLWHGPTRLFVLLGQSLANAAFVSWVPPMDKMGFFNPLKYRNVEVN